MYKIMLADDEGIVIEALEFIIRKHFGDTCVIRSAKTGRSVIELAESFRPDIAFMDVQMPGINGIEAMREIRNANLNTVIIVLSAYDTFDYAKEALNLGCLDYINKPIDKDVIISLLNKAMAKVDAERQKRSNDLLIREKLETVVPIIENGFIYSVLFQENFKEDTENFKKLLSIEADSGYMMVLECGDAQEGVHLTNTIGASVRAYSYYTELREIVKEYFPNAVIGSMMANKVIIFVPDAETRDEEEYQERIKDIELGRAMVRKLKKRLDAQFRIGMGSTRRLDEAEISYREALSSFNYATGSVAHVKDLPIQCEYESDYPVETEKALFEKTQEGDVNGAIMEANAFFNWMVENYSDYPMDIKLKALEFVLLAEHISYESGGMKYRFRSRKDYLQTIIDMGSYEELRVWFETKIQEACRNVVTRKEETTNDIVERAKEYIREKYNRDISLDEVSKEVNISPYYFSKVFKEKAGENFIDYLTNIRMDKAKELLSQSDKSVKEVCNEVGYADPNYFSRMFKKKTGKTPTEYKEEK